MLKQLSLQNFVIAESLTLNFEGGLCVLTGETGAGKSLIVDAIQGVLGQRISPDAIRQGAEFAYLEAVFEPTPAIRELLAQRAYHELLDAEQLVISKTVHPSGSRSRLNGQLVTQSLIRELGTCLLDSIGQHENQALFHEDRHLAMLDALGDADHQDLRAAVSEAFHRWQLARREHQLLSDRQQALLRQQDFLRFQLQEIDAAELQPDEEDSLQAEHERLRHAEKLLHAAGLAYQGLCDAGETPAICEQLESVQRVLSGAARHDERLATLVEQLEQALIVLQEAGRELSHYPDLLECDPARLDQLQQRLAELQRLKRKYGTDLAGILAEAERLRAELEEAEQADSRLAELASDLAAAEAHYLTQASALSQARQQLAQRLVPALLQELEELGLARSCFEVQLTPTDTRSATGGDTVRFLFSANPGEPPRPLARIASGGEASRLLLAFKLVLKQANPVSCMIFDEIDTGISGKAALVVAQKLARLAQSYQIICISHLPVIAAMADQQLWLEKQVSAAQTQVQVQRLRPAERVQRLAQMGHGQITDYGLQGARDLFDTAQGFKQGLDCLSGVVLAS